jgi:hypothetical protein
VAGPTNNVCKGFIYDMKLCTKMILCGGEITTSVHTFSHISATAT